MGVKKDVGLALAGVVSLFGISTAAIPATEVVTLPSEAAYGGGDKVGSQLVAATYNAGEGPGIWIVADGGYRLYHNGALLAEDNQAGRVRFVPMTFLPGENAISVVGVNGKGAPGVLVQIDDLDKSYYSGSDWKSKPSVGNASWKNKGRDLSQWGGATALSYSSDKLPSGGSLSGFAANTQAKWIWTSAETDPTAVLLFTFNVKAEGFGASTTGGAAGNIVFASDSASIRKYLQSNDAVTILVPEGTYDFRQLRNAVTEAKSKSRTWCKKTCDEKNAVTGKTNTFYRITFKANSCADLNESGVQIVQESENLKQWDNWITTKANKTLVGMGRGANLRGAAIAIRSNEGSYNHIYRNLAIYDVNPHLIEGGDGLETVGTASKHVKGFWADHISYKWISDGMDMEFLDDATISYLDFDGANEYNCWGTDPYMALVEDAHLTYANNYWHNTYGRVPKVTGENNGSQVHLYNQYVDYNRFFVAGANGHSASAKAYVRYENSYIDNGNGYLAEWGDYGYVYFSGVTLGSKTKQQHRYNGTVTQGIPQAETFNPSYSFEKRTVANLPKEIPNLSGVGGRYGKMPEYDQGFGQSNKAASVSMTAPSAGAKFDAGKAVTLSAIAKDNDGSVKKVDFYVGTTLVGSATASPYQVNAEGLAPGTHSAVAVVTDNSGLTWMSEYVTFTVEGTLVESSSSVVPESSSSEMESSSSATTAIAQRVNLGTEAETAYYRIFDLQGRPLFTGMQMPAKMPAAHVMVVEYSKNGSVNRRYLKNR
ncbi:Ig-like domain-containing protein [Fibrobacter sp. UWB10]|uniref:Ig-like domain-containing protein n=1 Tax=Fibrobacter sp. UWB10 TaxID=1896201 RepID=UPI002403248B|nr:Ig-like domain-containing protein [Fibrobacter sp. UWB10]SMP57050.1 Pectate lyase [Fibrobacter sp. UWB10]